MKHKTKIEIAIPGAFHGHTGILNTSRPHRRLHDGQLYPFCMAKSSVRHLVLAHAAVRIYKCTDHHLAAIRFYQCTDRHLVCCQTLFLNLPDQPDHLKHLGKSCLHRLSSREIALCIERPCFNPASKGPCFRPASKGSCFKPSWKGPCFRRASKGPCFRPASKGPVL